MRTIPTVGAAASALWLAACAGGGGSGGRVDVGTDAGACTPTVVDVNTVATFEDGFGSVLQQGNPPRNGGFYAYNDQGAGCMETPADGSVMPAATAIPGGRCGSQYAFRFFGSGCSGYAGVGTDLAAPLPADASADDGGADDAAAASDDGGATTLKTPYDLSGYKQITFWGRYGDGVTPPTQKVQVKLPMLTDTKIMDGGLCVESETAKCSASYGRFFTFTTSWQLYTIDLIPRLPGMCTSPVTGICQEIWGKVFDWNPKIVTSIQFQAAANATYDIWIDDIALVPGVPGP
jgi:hypothetical protein